MKQGRNKYQREARGELMLVHECTECKTLSINRIAADDDPDMIMTTFHESLTLGHHIQALCQQNGIAILTETDARTVQAQLFGRTTELTLVSWG
jgi:hypothetical protein